MEVAITTQELIKKARALDRTVDMTPLIIEAIEQIFDRVVALENILKEHRE